MVCYCQVKLMEVLTCLWHTSTSFVVTKQGTHLRLTVALPHSFYLTDEKSSVLWGWVQHGSMINCVSMLDSPPDQYGLLHNAHNQTKTCWVGTNIYIVETILNSKFSSHIQNFVLLWSFMIPSKLGSRKISHSCTSSKKIFELWRRICQSDQFWITDAKFEISWISKTL